MNAPPREVTPPTTTPLDGSPDGTKIGPPESPLHEFWSVRAGQGRGISSYQAPARHVACARFAVRSLTRKVRATGDEDIEAIDAGAGDLHQALPLRACTLLRRPGVGHTLPDVTHHHNIKLAPSCKPTHRQSEAGGPNQRRVLARIQR
jgi:hypothetical protein